MKILEVHGDDYAALRFEDELGEPVKEWAELCASNNGRHEDEAYGIEAELHEFGEADPKFVEWVKGEFLEYDDSKHHNFYVVEA